MPGDSSSLLVRVTIQSAGSSIGRSIMLRRLAAAMLVNLVTTLLASAGAKGASSNGKRPFLPA